MTLATPSRSLTDTADDGVERTFAWIVKCRRLDHDYERLPETSEAMIKWAMIGLMVRRLEPPPGRKPWHRASTAA